MSSIIEEKEKRDQLLANVKKEVKQLMEEAVTKKFVHEDSACITSLCATIEQCLLHGLQRRSVGLFKSGTTMALLQKVSKNFEPADQVLKMCKDYDDAYCNSNFSFIPRKLFSNQTQNETSSKAKNFAPTFYKGSNCYKYLWIRLALLNQLLNKIIEYIISESNKFYAPYSLVADPVDGPIFSSLLVGPCALEYTRLKTSDHLWTDPNADELIQRYRMHNSNFSSMHGPMSPCTNPYQQVQSPKHRFGYNASSVRLKRNASTSINVSIDDCGSSFSRFTPLSSPTIQNPSSQSASTQLNTSYHAKEYVESLHQNSKSQIIYGKNYVIVYLNEEMQGLPGYLSLHTNPNGLILKWTPNQLMNGALDETTAYFKSKNVYWDYAINIDLNSIVYLHCHQQTNRGSVVILVGQDGVQYPPICFPKGSHLLQFLTCLENGLAPDACLDPPLSLQDGIMTEKTLPKVKASNANDLNNNAEVHDFEPKDFVFRIRTKISEDQNPENSNIFRQIYNTRNTLTSFFTSFSSTNDHKADTCPPTPTVSVVSNLSPTSSLKDLAQSTSDPNQANESKNKHVRFQKSPSMRSSMKLVCDAMKHQIVSRAFYGWLTYVRHLKTVRLHLADLVNDDLAEDESFSDNVDFKLTSDIWSEWLDDEKSNKISLRTHEKQFYSYIYNGGIDHNIRKHVWPFLLQHHTLDMNEDERHKKDLETNEYYKDLVKQWKPFEECGRLRENAAKLQYLTSTAKTTNGDSIDESQILTLPKNQMDLTMTPIVSKSPQSVSTKSKIRAMFDKAHSKSILRNDLILLRKDSGLSNDVFIEDRDLNMSIENVQNNLSILLADDIVNDGLSSDALNEGLIQDEELNKSVRTSTSRRSSTCSYILFDANEMTPNELLDLSKPLATDHNGGTRKSLSDMDLIENFAINMHRIDKDVTRCDRNYVYFTSQHNLQKIRDIMYTYVWENLNIGYIQGMCDLVAPLLVIFDDESIAYSCFKHLMHRMLPNFPHGNGMDTHFNNMRSLIQILDTNLYEQMHQCGDNTHFFFSYRWFLLDFKRELVYDDIFTVWETIWSAQNACTKHFSLFIALALIETYRDIIIDNDMDFTDIIKFFNEMAEKHNTKCILKLARDLVKQLQTLITNKDEYYD